MAPAAQATSWPAWRNRHLPASAGNELFWRPYVRVIAMQESDPSCTAHLWESTSCSSGSSSHNPNTATTIGTTIHLQQSSERGRQHLAAAGVRIGRHAQHEGHVEQGCPLRQQLLGQLPNQRLQGRGCCQSPVGMLKALPSMQGC